MKDEAIEAGTAAAGRLAAGAEYRGRARRTVQVTSLKLRCHFVGG
jgi:hypothetical protein